MCNNITFDVEFNELFEIVREKREKKEKAKQDMIIFKKKRQRKKSFDVFSFSLGNAHQKRTQFRKDCVFFFSSQ